MLGSLDLGTRKFWRLVGHEIDLSGPEAWLDAPMSESAIVGDQWLAAEAARHGGTLEADRPGAGLLASMSLLDGPTFDSSRLLPEIRDFYEHTSDWHMEVWTGWSPWAWPGGEVISRLFGQRVEQLALPMRPLDVARGMDSQVTPILDGTGRQVAAGWSRTLSASGRVVFSGAYSAGWLPRSEQPRVHVAFPLESGNLQVSLRPSVVGSGELLLDSPRGRFGDDGAYIVVRDQGRVFAARVPLHETFHMYADDRGTLRTDHELCFGRASAVRLHYKLERRR